MESHVADLTVIPYFFGLLAAAGAVGAAVSLRRRVLPTSDGSAGNRSAKEALRAALMWAAAAAAAVLAFGGVTSAFGSMTGQWRNVSVLSGSMSPTINRGDMAVVVSRPASEIRVGDVVVFNAPETSGIVRKGEPVIHRVIELVASNEVVGGRSTATYIRTQGDNNPEPDRWIVEVTGTAWVQVATVRDAGDLFLLLARPSARAGLLLGAAVIFAGSAAMSLMRSDESDDPDGLDDLSGHGGDHGPGAAAIEDTDTTTNELDKEQADVPAHQHPVHPDHPAH